MDHWGTPIDMFPKDDCAKVTKRDIVIDWLDLINSR